MEGSFDELAPGHLEAAVRQMSPRLERLARSLVQDADEAADLVQQTWFHALRAGASSSFAHWPFLRRVLQHEAYRRHRRRTSREESERLAAREEAHAAESDGLRRLERHQELMALVHALDEIHRQVIVLRYIEGLSTGRIAELLDLPVRAVESRLRRAKEALRERLDRAHGARERWLGLWIPLLRPERGLVSATAIVPLATVLAVVVSLLVASRLGSSRPMSTEHLARIDATTGDRSVGPGEPAPRPPGDGTVGVTAAQPTVGARTLAVAGHHDPAPPSRADTQGTARFARVVDLDGAPVGEVVLSLARQRPARTEPWRAAVACADADGWVTPSEDLLSTVESAPDGQAGLRPVLEVDDPRWCGVTRADVHAGSSWMPTALVVAPRTRAFGVVQSEAGLPVEGATVSAVAPAVRLPALDGLAPGATVDTFLAATDRAGAFVLDPLPDVEHWVITVEHSGFLPVRRTVTRSEASHALEFVLAEDAVPGTVTVQGRVEDERGRPLSGTLMCIGPWVTSSSSDGQFTLSPGPNGQAAALVAARAGYEPAQLPRERWAGAAELVVRLRPLMRSAVEVVVRDRDGAPLADALVGIADTTPLTCSWLKGRSTARARSAEMVAARATTPCFERTTDVDGRCRFEGLPSRELTLVAVTPDLRRIEARLAPGQQRLELRLATGPPAPITGLVVDLSGLPVRGVAVHTHREVLTPPVTVGLPSLVARRVEPVLLAGPTADVEDGRFVLAPCDRSALELTVPGTFVRAVEWRDPTSCVVTVAREVPFQARLEDPDSDVVMVVALDAAGRRLPYRRPESARIAPAAELDVVDGTSALVFVPEDAHGVETLHRTRPRQRSVLQRASDGVLVLR